jgi:DNA-binding transcriptional MerR regulator
VDGEEHGASSAQPPGEPPREYREDLSGSGDVTTKQAAKALGVSRRSVQAYVRQGLLEAREEGEGVNRRFLISIDSLNALLDRRKREADATANFAEASPQSAEAARAFANTGEGLRHLIERLEARTAEATELRIRLEITERAQSALEEEQAKALDELAEERRRRVEAEAERDELRRQLEPPPEAPQSPESEASLSPGDAAPPETSGEAQEATARPEPRSWLRRMLGI